MSHYSEEPRFKNSYPAPPPHGQVHGPEGEPPLAYPMYGAGPGTAVKRLFLRWNRFKGRSSRSEFWWAYLFANIILTILYVLVGVINGLDEDGYPAFKSDTPAQLEMTIVFAAFTLVMLVPMLSVSWRRLHDAGFAGPWYFLNVILFFGTIAFIIMTVFDTRPNRMKRKWEDPEVMEASEATLG